jgi:hypothetical protein
MTPYVNAVFQITKMSHLYFGRQSAPHKAIVNRTGGLSYTHNMDAASSESVPPGSIKFKIGGLFVLQYGYQLAPQ